MYTVYVCNTARAVLLSPSLVYNIMTAMIIDGGYQKKRKKTLTILVALVIFNSSVFIIILLYEQLKFAIQCDSRNNIYK